MYYNCKQPEQCRNVLIVHAVSLAFSYTYISNFKVQTKFCVTDVIPYL